MTQDIESEAKWLPDRRSDERIQIVDIDEVIDSELEDMELYTLQHFHAYNVINSSILRGSNVCPQIR